jgi:hypothetical protein
MVYRVQKVRFSSEKCCPIYPRMKSKHWMLYGFVPGAAFVVADEDTSAYPFRNNSNNFFPSVTRRRRRRRGQHFFTRLLPTP